MNDFEKRRQTLSPEKQKLLELYLKNKQLEHSGGFSNIKPVAEQEYYPVSAAQKRLYLINFIEGASITYNMPMATMVEGKFDADQLKKALQTLVQRHESLRTSFVLLDKTPVQQIHQTAELDVTVLEADESKIKDLVGEMISPFDLSKAPLFRVWLVKFSEVKYLLVYDLHHIIVDGISAGIIIKEMLEIYNGKFLPELQIQYKDFASWQNDLLRSEEIKKQEEYWLHLFGGEIPILDMPTDYPRPPVQSFEGDHLSFEIDQKLTKDLRVTAKNSGATLFMVLLAAFNILLAKYSGQEDIIVGSPSAGRQHTDLENLVGMFVNTLALRNFPEGNKTYLQFLEEVKDNLLKAYENQDYQFEELVGKIGLKRDFSRNPLFDVMFVFQDMPRVEIESAGLRFKPYELYNNVSKFDFTLTADEGDGNIVFNLEYGAKLYKKATMGRFKEHFCNTLREIVKQSGLKLSEIDILAPEEKKRILTDFNNTEAEYPAEKTIYELFEEQVEKTPGQVAIIYGDRTLTYRELNSKANKIATELREKGINAGSIAAIIVDRSPETIAGILGILKSGGAYLPLDPSYPRERIRYMLEDSEARLLLTIPGYEEETGFAGEVLPISDTEFAESPAGAPDLRKVNGPEDPAYLIYTSGTTGIPKGVLIAHRSITNTIFWRKNEYQLGTSDTVLQLFSCSFDGFLTSFFTPIVSGARVVLLTEETSKDPVAIKDAITVYQVTHFICVPALYASLLDYINAREAASLKIVTLAGDKPVSDLITKSLSLDLHFELVNEYGPTENSVASTFLRNLQKAPEITVGKPINNTRVYIINKDKTLTPVNVRGELCLSGAGLSKGYLHHPELTAQKFIPNPFVPGEKMYCTGDLARWRTDGNIEFLGREDFQVKIRGFRIELEEIEARLLKHEAVHEAVVLAKEDKNGDKYLCAYIVSHREIIADELKGQLAGELPGYMIPSHFVKIGKIPRNLNGKVDKKALLEDEAYLETGREYVAPGDIIEMKLVEIWKDVLDINHVGVNDDFFELGGHSLKATVLSAQIHKHFNIELSVGEIFRRTTIRKLAENISIAKRKAYSSIQPAAESDYYSAGCYPTSPAQKRLYLTEMMGDVRTAYNLPGIMIVEGEIDRQRFGEVFKLLIQRHQTLRTSFELLDGDLVQRIHEDCQFTVVYTDYTGYDGKKQEERVSAYLKAFIKPFDLGTPPLLRVSLIKLMEEKHLFMFDLHHIIADGVSIGILIREFAALFNGNTLPELRIQFKDFAAWQNDLLRTGVMENQEHYWLERLNGEIPVLNIPTDFSRPPARSFEGDSLSFVAEPELTVQINKLALETGSTVYMVLLAAYNVLLAKYTGQDDIIVGSPIAGRKHADLDSIIGMFVNTLVMRNHPEERKTFGEFLGEVRLNALDAYENQDYQFEDLVNKLELKRDFGRNPLFDTMFGLQNTDQKVLEVGGLRFIPFAFENKVSKFDLTLNTVENGGKLEFMLEYCDRLFKRETIERLAGHFINVLRIITGNHGLKLTEIEVIGDAEKKQVLYAFNRTKTEFESAKTVSELFEETTVMYPDQIAIIWKERMLTYRELNQKANCLAKLLREQGIVPDTIVALKVERSPEMIIGILGVLKAGGAYLPLDPAHPAERIGYMLADSRADILLIDSEDAEIEVASGAFSSVRTINLKDESIYWGDGANLRKTGEPGNLAYIIYTSGTTGRPKGVMIEHMGMTNTVQWRKKAYDLGTSDKVLQLFSYAFDGFVTSFFTPIISGAGVVLPDEAEAKDPHVIKEIIVREGITHFICVPAFLSVIMDTMNETEAASLKIITLAGEKPTQGLLARCKTLNPLLELVNEYGPTENSVASTFMRNIQPGALISIGKPIDNTEIYIVDKNNKLNPVGVPGELCLAGAGLARGYLHNPGLTAEKFIPNPFYNKQLSVNSEQLRDNYKNNFQTSARLYKTGDLARWLPGGYLEFLGRMDYQVKIRGFRIELEEIESRLLNIAGIKEAVVIDKDDRDGFKYLCAYLVSEEELPADGLRKQLLTELPDYMVPSYFVSLPEIPLTVNGKVDRRALPEPDGGFSVGVEYVAPRNEVERIMAEIWQEVLGVEKVGINDSFFNIGGHSLKAMIISDICKKSGIDLPVQAMFKYATISVICENLNLTIDPAALDSSLTIETVDKAEIPLTVVSTATTEAAPAVETGCLESGRYARTELRIKLQREVTIYLHRAYPLCIILANPKFTPWYYQHLVQISGQIHRDGFIILDYHEPRYFFPEIMDYTKLSYEQLEETDNLVKFIIAGIDQGSYVSVCMDEYYLKGKMSYLKVHFVHENFIYGYNNIERNFLGLGFNDDGLFAAITYEYEAVTKAFADGKIYYKKTAPYAKEIAVQILTPKEIEKEYPFDLELFLNELNDFICSRGDNKRMLFVTPPSMKRPHGDIILPDEYLKYGLDVTNLVIDRFERLIKGEILVDYRVVHLLAEHRKGLMTRFRYIVGRYGLTGADAGIVENYQAIVDDFEMIRIKTFKMTNSQDDDANLKTLHQIIECMKSTINREKTILNDIYKWLSNGREPD